MEIIGKEYKKKLIDSKVEVTHFVKVKCSMKTDLWGYFNIPKKNPVEPVFYISGGKRFPPLWGKTGGKSKNRQMLRSITPPGFAKAFFEANK